MGLAEWQAWGPAEARPSFAAAQHMAFHVLTPPSPRLPTYSLPPSHHMPANVLKTAAVPKSTNFLGLIFEPSPKPFNCSNHHTTAELLENPGHPYYVRVKRRIDSFDPSKLYWTVNAHVDVAKKRVVRSWAKRRVEVAFAEELRARGWGSDGAVLTVGKDGRGNERKQALRGALRVFMASDRRKEILTATGEEVRANVRSILETVVRKQRPMPKATDLSNARNSTGFRPSLSRKPLERHATHEHGARRLDSVKAKPST